MRATRGCGDPEGTDGGFVAGFEALAFGVLVFVLGTLLIVNAWAVLDAAYAVNAASRVASRAVAAAGPGLADDDLVVLARGAAERAVRAHGHDPTGMGVALLSVAQPARCTEVTVTVDLSVSVAGLPGLGDAGRWQVTSRAHALVAPLRRGLGNVEASCAFW